MVNATIAQKYGTAPRAAWTGIEKIPLDVSGADGVGLVSTLKAYVNAGDRVRLAANTTYYVATTGNDSTGDGSVGAPWASPQKAWDYICANVDVNGKVLTVQLANGTYRSTVNNAPVLDLPKGFNQPNTNGETFVGGGTVIFQGNPADRTLVKLSQQYPVAAVVMAYLQQINRIVFNYMQLIHEGSSSRPNMWIEASGSAVQLTDIDVGGVTSDAQFAFISAASVQVLGDTTILPGSNANSHIYTNGPTLVEHLGTVAVPSPVTFHAFFDVEYGSTLWAHGDYSAALANFTGKKYIIYGGILDILFNSLAGLPGQSQVITLGGSPSAAHAPGVIFWGAVTSNTATDTYERGSLYGLEFKTGAAIDTTDVLPYTFGIFKDVSAGGKAYLAYHDYDASVVVKNVIGEVRKAGAPAATDIPAGCFTVFKDTSAGTVVLAYNDAGTIKKVTLT